MPLFLFFCLFVFLIVLPSTLRRFCKPTSFMQESNLRFDIKYLQHLPLSRTEQCFGFTTISYTGIHMSHIKSCVKKNNL